MWALFSVFGWYPPYYVYHKYNWGSEPPIPESHEDEKCISQWYGPGKTPISGQQECGKEVDPKVPELGPGTQPADRLVRGASYGLFIGKENAGTAAQRVLPFQQNLIPSALVVLSKIPSLIPEAGCGQRPQDWQSYKRLIMMQKNKNRCIKSVCMVRL